MKTRFKYLRKEKQKAMELAYQKGIDRYDELKCEKYEDAVILPAKKVNYAPGSEFGWGGIIDKEGNYIELSKNSAYFGGGYKVDQPGRDEKTAVYCGYLFEHAWGHFLIDIVPRLWWVLEADENVDEYVIIGEDNDKHLLLQGNILEFLKLLGIADKITILTEPRCYKKVIVPQLSYSYGSVYNGENSNKYYSMKYLQTFTYVAEKALLQQSGRKKYNNVFFTRSGLAYPGDRECGIELLDNLFQNNGYCILHPERLSLHEMIYVLNNCNIIACVSGTCQHNLLFSIRKVNSVVIERHSYINSIQNDIDMMKGLDTIYIDANYCVLPVSISRGPFIYAYNHYLQKYIFNRNMNLPDYQYTTRRYRSSSVIRYLKDYVLPENPWWEGNKKEYILAACNESIEELRPDFHFIPYNSLSDFMDVQKTQDRILKYLMEFDIEYNGWKGMDLYLEFERIIERVINEGITEFIIYPFGRNGILFKDILNKKYGIREKAVFDNKLCKYNPQIKSLKEIDRFYNSTVCLVLTSSRYDCRCELLEHCQSDGMIEGPFFFR